MARLIIHTDNAINDKATKLIFGEQLPKVTRVNRYKNTDNVPKFFVKSNQYLPNGFGRPAATYYYITNEAGEVYHHRDDKFRKKPLKDVSTYWYKDLGIATIERVRLINRTMY